MIRNIWSELKILCVTDFIYKESSLKEIYKFLKRKLFDLGYKDKNQRDIKINEILEIIKLHYAN